MKNKIFFRYAYIILILIFLVKTGFAYASDPITNPNMKSPNMYPDYNDTYFTYYDDIVGYKSKGLWGFYCKNDKSVNIPAIYSDIKGLDISYIKVKSNGYWGIIDVYGSQKIEPKYDEIETFSFGFWGDYFKVKSDNLYGILDSNGREIIPVRYNAINEINKYYAKVGYNGLYGIYSVNDKREIIPLKYEDINVLDSWFKVKQNGFWGVIDINQNQIISADYEDIKKLNNSFFIVKNYNLWGTVSVKTGKEIIKPNYDKIEYAKLNYLKVKKNGKWGIVDYDGTLIKPIVNGPFEINKVVRNLR